MEVSKSTDPIRGSGDLRLRIKPFATAIPTPADKIPRRIFQLLSRCLGQGRNSLISWCMTARKDWNCGLLRRIRRFTARSSTTTDGKERTGGTDTAFTRRIKRG